jgi:hypothetical protein
MNRKGIGVRIAIYIQAFLAAITGVLRVGEELVIDDLDDLDKASRTTPPTETLPPSPQKPSDGRTAVQWDEILDVVYPNHIVGCALIVAAIVQSRTFGLTVYHALVVLNLSLVITFSASPSFMIRDGKTRVWGSLENHSFRFMAAWHLVHLSLTAAFALWFFADMVHFDKTGTGCPGSTVYYALGKHVHVGDPSFRRFWLGIYSIVLIPAVNFAFISAVYFMAFSLAFAMAILPIAVLVACVKIALGKTKSDVVYHAIFMLFVLVPPVFMVVITERTIKINVVGMDEKLWTFGQTLALMVAIPPAWKTWKLVKATFMRLNEKIQVGFNRSVLARS